MWDNTGKASAPTPPLDVPTEVSAPVVNQVTPPASLVPKKMIHYDVCQECNQVHDGTGRFMDQRGKLIAKSKVKKCSQS